MLDITRLECCRKTKFEMMVYTKHPTTYPQCLLEAKTSDFISILVTVLYTCFYFINLWQRKEKVSLVMTTTPPKSCTVCSSLPPFPSVMAYQERLMTGGNRWPWHWLLLLLPEMAHTWCGCCNIIPIRPTEDHSHPEWQTSGAPVRGVPRETARSSIH